MSKYDETAGLHKYAPDDAREIAERLIDKVLADGYEVGIHEGEDWAIRKSVDRDAILCAMCSTGADKVYIRKEGKCLGWFYLIYENGHDCMSDFVDNSYCCEVANHALQEQLFG